MFDTIRGEVIENVLDDADVITEEEGATAEFEDGVEED